MTQVIHPAFCELQHRVEDMLLQQQDRISPKMDIRDKMNTVTAMLESLSTDDAAAMVSAL